MSTTTSRRELLDSRDPYDAGILGYDGRRDPAQDGEGLIFSVERGTPNAPWFYIQTAEGESAPIHHHTMRQIAEEALRYLAHHTPPANDAALAAANDQVAA
jgi:hypothetical protein